jgi:hypothetical protein
LYTKLSQQDRNVIKAVNNAQKQGTSTTEGVTTELEKIANSKTDVARLNQKLAEAENAGLIKKSISNVDDEPSTQWRNQIGLLRGEK